MRCTHAEKLIPLFAGDDLPARKANALRQHLESCANCRRIAAEFEESRNWLRGFTEPQFDEAMLSDLRDSVLRDIGRVENRSLWIQSIVPGWNLRFVTSMSVLLLIALIATFVYRGMQPRLAPGKDGIADANPSDGGRPNDHVTNVNSFPVPTRHPPRERRSKNIETTSVKPIQPPDQVIALVLPSRPPISVEPGFELPAGGDMAMDNAIFNREMTRIEFLTADPNIRIIWLTPKDSDSSSTKPNTNNR